MNPNTRLLGKGNNEEQSARTGIIERSQAEERANALLQKTLKKMCEEFSAAEITHSNQPLRQDKKIDPACTLNGLKGGLERQTGGKNSTIKTGKQCSKTTTCALQAPSTESSWAHFDKAERGLGVYTSSAYQPWRLQEWDRVPGELSETNMTAYTSTRPASRLMTRHGHGHMLVHHHQVGMSATEPLKLSAAHKWPVSSPMHKSTPPASPRSGQSSLTWSKRSIASEERTFDELLELSLKNHSPLSCTTSVRTNDRATKLEALEKVGFEKSIRRWGLGSKQPAVCQGGTSTLQNGTRTSTALPKSAPLGSKSSLAINIRIAELEARSICQPAKSGAMQTLTGVRVDVQGSKQPKSGADPKPVSGSMEGTTSGPGSGTHLDSGSAKDEGHNQAKRIAYGADLDEKDTKGEDANTSEVGEKKEEKPGGENEGNAQTVPTPPPPPSRPLGKTKKGALPPPAPRLLKNKMGACEVQRQPQVISMFHELRRSSTRDQRKIAAGKKSGSGSKAGGGDATSLFAEIGQNSRYAQSVQRDIVQYDGVIKDLIQKIAQFKASSMRHLLDFVQSTDSTLDELTDETAVLKAFQWPKKYDVLREARAIHEEMEELKGRLREWKEVPARSLQAELEEMRKYVKCIKRVDDVMRNKDAEEKRFKEAGIPWDGKVIRDVQHASLCLMHKYMGICLDGVKKIEDRETRPDRARAKCLDLLTGTVRFAFRIHQFAGGFTEDCSTRFAEVSAKTRALKKQESGEGENENVDQAKESSRTQEL